MRRHLLILHHKGNSLPLSMLKKNEKKEIIYYRIYPSLLAEFAYHVSVSGDPDRAYELFRHRECDGFYVRVDL